MYLYIFTSLCVMAGTIEHIQFVLLCKLPWFVLVCLCMYMFDSIFAPAYFIIGIWVVA
jgi:TM2 domain-containing membrane protein YozV